MKRHGLIDHLTRQGCHLVREGGRHSIYANPVTAQERPYLDMAKSTTALPVAYAISLV